MSGYFLTAAAADAAAIAKKHCGLLDSLGLASAAAVVQEEGGAAPIAAPAAPAEGSGETSAATVKRIQRRLAAAAENAKRRKIEIAGLARRNLRDRAELDELRARIAVAKADTAAACEDFAQSLPEAGLGDAPALVEGAADREQSPVPHRLESGRYGVIAQLFPEELTREGVISLIREAGAPRAQRAEFQPRLLDKTQQVLLSYDAKAEAVKARAALHNFPVGDCPPLPLRAFYQDPA